MSVEEPTLKPIVKRPYRKYFTAQDKALVNEYMASFTDKQQQTLLIAQDHLKTSFDVLKSGGFVSWITRTAIDAAKNGQLTLCNNVVVGETPKGRCYIMRDNIYIYETAQKTLFDSIVSKKIDCPVVAEMNI